jgi:hypothetical protein
MYQMTELSRRFLQLLLCGVACAVSANALASFSVSQDGLTVTVTITDTDTTDQTVHVEYQADFGGSPDADSWIGAYADSLSIQFGGNEVTGGGNVSSPSGTSGWTIQVGKTAANGCGDSPTSSVCLEKPTGGEAGGTGELLIAANSTATWEFDVDFAAGVNVADAIACGELLSCSIKFSAVEQNQQGRWVLANQLSQSTAVSEPGTLTLLGLGLIVLAAGRRRMIRPTA